MKHLHERSTTLPQQCKTTIGNDGNQRRKATVNTGTKHSTQNAVVPTYQNDVVSLPATKQANETTSWFLFTKRRRFSPLALSADHRNSWSLATGGYALIHQRMKSTSALLLLPTKMQRLKYQKLTQIRWLRQAHRPTADPNSNEQLRKNLSPICLFFESVQGICSQRPPVKTWGWFKVCTEIIRSSMFDCLKPVGCVNFCTDLVPVGSVVGDYSIPRMVEDYVSYRIQIIDVISVHSSDSNSSSTSSSQNQMDSRVNSPMDEETSANQIDFLVDTPVDEETPVTQISLPAVDTTDVTESFSQLRASITRLYINQLKTSSKIGDLQNHLLFKLKNIGKAFTEALTNQEQVHHNLINSARQETQNQKAALSLEILKYQKEVRAQHAVMITDLTDIRSQNREIQALKKDFTDFQQKTESGIAHVSSHISEIIAYINRGGNDKKGESSSRSRSRLRMMKAEKVVVVVEAELIVADILV
ncbi:hypothetical protein F511_04853 [Dorcoceras hygrometricum]|uniref:Uncharacterized protein n=1 Tax=Dorcoceras hygrometricum TaxID=472368 RepID=A0A2Z7DF26_9LAMI|nr:hypothetical protein F511_04853 [Dorcoceras hygrometricum]